MENIYYIFLILILTILFLFLSEKYYEKNKKSECKIKIIGLGGGGSNIVEYLSNKYPLEYDALIINSDKKALETKNVDKKILLQKDNNYGCGSNIVCGYTLVTSDVILQIKYFIERNEDIYIFVTLGGGCGTGSLKAIAQEFKDSYYKLNFILITPFKWEGIKKSERANEIIKEIKNNFRNVYIYSNDELLSSGDLGINECFKIQNEKFNKLIKEGFQNENNMYKTRLYLTIEDILDLIEEKKNLYRLKTKVYNETLKSYMLIFNQIKNLDFSAKLKYNEIGFTTIIIDNNIGNISIQDNIFMKFDTLDFLNKELSEKINEISEIVNLCKDYSKLEKENKKLIKEGYALYRYSNTMYNKLL